MFEMLRLETLHPSELTDADIVAWRRLCASRPEFSSPLMGPDFARAVGAVQPDIALEACAIFKAGHRLNDFR